MLEKIWKAAATRRARSRERMREHAPALLFRHAQAVVAAAVMVALAGCATQPRVMVQGDPSDPDVPVRPVTYSSTLGPYQSGRPVEPSPWRLQNERVTPQQKSE